MQLIDFKRFNSNDMLALIIGIPVIGFLIYLSFSGSMLSPLAWVGLFVMGKGLYMDIFHPEPDEADAETVDISEESDIGSKEPDVGLEDEDEEPIVDDARTKTSTRSGGRSNRNTRESMTPDYTASEFSQDSDRFS